jgi:hypothetical protein
MNYKQALAALIFMAATSFNSNTSEDEDVKDIEVKYVPNRGLKPFKINGKTIWAINRKNAERKARKEETK